MTDARRGSLFVVQQYSFAEDCLGLGRLGSCFSQRCKVTTKYCNEFVAAEGGRFSSHLHYLDLTMDDWEKYFPFFNSLKKTLIKFEEKNFLIISII